MNSKVGCLFFSFVSFGLFVHAEEVRLDQTRRVANLQVAKEAVAKKGWSARFSVNLDAVKEKESLVEIPGALTVSLRMAGKDASLFEYDSYYGNYLNFKQPDGACPILEAVVPGRAGRIGIPLGALSAAGGVHHVTLSHTVANWVITVDGAKDQDWLIGDPAWPANPVCRLLSPRISEFVFTSPADPLARGVVPDVRPIQKPIQFFTPDDHNAWVGDVAIGTHEGRFHLFYLYDRRHHRSKGGGGGHTFAHLSSTDLVHWVEHPLAVSIEKQYESVGTGTPFVFKGKFCISYGWHTSRFASPEEIVRKGYPMGAAYSVSDDGIHFTRVEKCFLPIENPSVYNRSDGLLGMVSGFGTHRGLYVSEDMERWVPYDIWLPVSGDCGCAFEWNGWHYVIQGFTQFCASPTGRPSTYKDWVGKGLDIYDGMSVPMVAPFKDGRMMYAGWINHLYGWGGWLCLRELVWEGEGRLGSKWVKECVPDVPVNVIKSSDKQVQALPADRQAIYQVQVDPAAGPAALRFCRGKDGGKDLEFRIEPIKRRAQFSDGERGKPAPAQKTLREGNRVCHAGAFAIENLLGVDRPFQVRLLVWYDAKANATLFDVEIAGRRTMVCRRPGRFVTVQVD